MKKIFGWKIKLNSQKKTKSTREGEKRKEKKREKHNNLVYDLYLSVKVFKATFYFY
jgi:hypothetical protein